MMSKFSHDCLGSALHQLNDGLRPEVERQLKLAYGPEWKEVVARRRSDRTGKSGISLHDPQITLTLIISDWNHFEKTFHASNRFLVSELREIRNRWAHHDTLSDFDVLWAVNAMLRLLQIIDAKEAKYLERTQKDLLREIAQRYEGNSSKSTKHSSTHDRSTSPAQPPCSLSAFGRVVNGAIEEQVRSVREENVVLRTSLSECKDRIDQLITASETLTQALGRLEMTSRRPTMASQLRHTTQRMNVLANRILAGWKSATTKVVHKLISTLPGNV